MSSELDLDLTNPANASQLTCTRASVGYHDSLAGVWTSFATNTPRITNRGLRVEEARTNSIRNNSMQGAVISPPTLPTNWGFRQLTNMTVSVVGVGVEKGIDYIDLRLVSPGGGALIWLTFEGNAQIVSANGQTWVGSTFAKIVSGDASAFDGDNLYLSFSINDASGNYVTEANHGTFYVPLTEGGLLTRLVQWETIADASGLRVQPFLWGVGNGPIDVTLRLGWPQLERNVNGFYGVTSPIRTTTAAATRAAEDVIINTFGSWYSAGDGSFAIFGDSDQYATVAVGTPGYMADATASNFIQFMYDAGTSYMIFYPPLEGAVAGHALHYRHAVGWSLGDVQYYANLMPMIHRTENTVPTFTVMHLGTCAPAIGYNGVDGPITRFKYWPRRLSDSELEAESFYPREYIDVTVWPDKFTDPVEAFFAPTMGKKIIATKFTDPVESFGAPKMGVLLDVSVFVDEIEWAGLPVLVRTGGGLVATLYESPAQFFGVPELIVFAPPELPPHFETEGPPLAEAPHELPDITSANYQEDGSIRIHYANDTSTEILAPPNPDWLVDAHLIEWLEDGHTIDPYLPTVTSYEVDVEKNRRIAAGVLVTLASGRMIALQTRAYPDFINLNFLATTAAAYDALPTTSPTSRRLMGGPSPFLAGNDPKVVAYERSAGYPDTRVGQGPDRMVVRDAYNLDQILYFEEMMEIGAKLTGTIQVYYNAAWQLKDTLPSIPLDYADDKYWPDYSYPPVPPSGYYGGLGETTLVDAWMWVGSDGILWSDGVTVMGVLDVLLLDNVVTAARAYSTRKLRNAYYGSAIRIRRSNDNAELDIGFVGGNLDTAAITTFVGSNSAYLTKWYDQSVNAAHLTQPTQANQPRIVNAGTLDARNSKATPFFTKTTTYMETPIKTDIYVHEVAGVIATNEGGSPPMWSDLMAAVGDDGYLNGAIMSDSVNAPFNTYLHEFGTHSVNGGPNTAVFGGVLQQVKLLSNGPLYRGVFVGARWAYTEEFYGLPGWYGEFVLWANAALSVSQSATVLNDQRAYWGTP